MRTMMMVEMDTEKANQAIKDQTLAQIMGQAMEKLSPEAAFFGAMDGMRTGFMVFDMKDPNQMPTICEPFFQQLGAKINMMPVMTYEDVRTGLKQYASA